MIDSSVELFQPIVSKKSDGTVVKAWGYKGLFPSGYWDDTITWDDTKYFYDGSDEIIIADVQPQGLSEAQLKQWGISTLSQDSKVMYFSGFSSYLIVGNRSRVDGSATFDIKSANIWPSHTEAILVPVMGE